MALITLDEFKTYLQITDTSYDTLYATYIEEVSADVEDMSNQFFNLQYVVNTTLNSQFLTSTVEQYDIFDGMTVTGTGIPDNSIVQNATMYQIELNKYATANGTGITATYNAVPLEIKPTIAKMVLYKISTSTVSNKGGVSDVVSKSMGPLSTAYGKGTQLDKDYEYPKNLVKRIQRIKRIPMDIGKVRRRGENITNEERYMYCYGE